MKRIYLIDCPGIVPPSQDETETDIVLKGVVRVENVKAPEDYVGPLLTRVKPEYIRKTYDVEEWEDHVDFLTQVAKKAGKLLKVHACLKWAINDVYPNYSSDIRVESQI
jgi:nuclear GTP-binding protein